MADKVYIQLQLRRGTASEWTTADPTLTAGEVGLETDTGKFKIGDGSTAWSSLAYRGDDIDKFMLKSIGTTKGDMIVFSGSATPARLGVGTDGQVLTVDPAESLGMKWAAPEGGDAGVDTDEVTKLMWLLG